MLPWQRALPWEERLGRPQRRVGDLKNPGRVVTASTLRFAWPYGRAQSLQSRG